MYKLILLFFLLLLSQYPGASLQAMSAAPHARAVEMSDDCPANHRPHATSRPAQPLPADRRDGQGLAIAGLVIGVFAVLLSVLAPLIIVLGGVGLALIGLGLSIWGLLRARQWRNNRRARLLAIIGIVANSLVILGWVVLFAWLLGLFNPQM